MSGALRLLRQLGRAPGFTLPVVAGLALAVGASTAVFSVFSAMLIRSLGFADAHRLVSLWRADEEHGQKRVELSYRDLIEWSKAGDVLEGMALVSSVNLDLTLYAGDRPEQVDSTTVSGACFRVLGARPFAGRLLTEDDDRPAAPPRLVLSYRLWRSRFGGDFGIIGRQVRVSGGEVTVVGVTRPEFDFPRDVAVWLPLHAAWPDVEKSAELGVFRAVARLRPGVSVEQARARLDAIARSMKTVQPPPGEWHAVAATPLIDEIYGAARPAVWILLGAVLLVLLIACDNAANMLLNRAAERSQELAIRMALGASRKQLVRLLVGESVALAAVAGGLGLLLAAVGTRVLAALAPADVPRIAEAAIDPQVLAFGLCATIVTVLLFGVGPAIQASHRDTNEALQQASRWSTGSASQSRLRRLLVAVEGGLSAMLLVGAGTLVHSFINLAAVNPGFAPQRILTFRVTVQESKQEARRARYSEILARLRSLPGVESAAAVLIRPLSGAVGWDTVYTVEGQQAGPPNPNPNGNYEAISPGYFRTMGVPLLAGRDFTASDTTTAPGVVIVDENTALRHWPRGDALGKRVRLGSGPQAPWLMVVGVAGAVHYREWEGAWPDLYVPYTQRAQHRTDFVVKTSGDSWKLASAVRREVFAVDKDQPISELTTMEALVDRTLSGSRFNGVIISALAACALLLAAVGIYAVLSYAVTQRRAEIGLRMAVGATPAHIVRLVAKELSGSALLGLIAGLAASLWLRGLLTKLVFGVGTIDPVAYAFAACVLAAIALAASVLPAWRAASIDPVQALQSQ
ncbi:MAG TPA: ABC transporter permease [Bryobacteraceae bacterium]|nr:ABC transporter permease [Bryobacteraceae bacterium]